MGQRRHGVPNALVCAAAIGTSAVLSAAMMRSAASLAPDPPVGGTGTPSVIRGDVDAIEAANELTSRDMQVMSRLDDVAQKRRDETAARRKAEAKRKAEERRRAEEEAKRKAELERSESWWRDGGQSYHRHDGLATAYLAVRVACTVDPEPTIRSGPGGEPGCYAKSDDPRAQDYIRVMETVTEPYGWGDGTYSNNALGSCTQASGHIIRATVDPDCWENSPENIQQYLEESPEWERVGELGGTPLADMCQPGDVLCNSGHTALYVGNEVVRRRYPDKRLRRLRGVILDRHLPAPHAPRHL